MGDPRHVTVHFVLSYLSGHDVGIQLRERGGAVRPVEPEGVQGPEGGRATVVARPPLRAAGVVAGACVDGWRGRRCRCWRGERGVCMCVCMHMMGEPVPPPPTRSMIDLPEEDDAAAAAGTPRPCLRAGCALSSRRRRRLVKGSRWPQGRWGTTREARSQSVGVCGAVGPALLQVGQAAVGVWLWEGVGGRV